MTLGKRGSPLQRGYWLNTWPDRAVLLTRANAADGYPKALTPLTQDLVVRFEDAGVRRFFEQTLGAMKPSDAPMPYLSALWGHVYLNADQLAALGDVLPGSSKQSIYQQYMGLEPDPGFRPRRRSAPERISELRTAVPVLRGMVRQARHANQRIVRQLEEIRLLRRSPVADERQCLEWVLALESVTVAAWETLMIGPGIASATFEVCQKVIRGAVRGVDGAELTNRLHVGLGGNESAEAGRMVKRLAAIARKNPVLAYAIGNGTSLPEIRAVDESFRQAFDEELERFGFHAAPQLELAQPTWRQDPTQVVRMVARELRRPIDTDDASGQIRAAAERELRTHTRFGLGWLCRLVLAMSRQQMALRENAKIPIVLIFDELRRVIEVAAPQLVGRSAIGSADDVVFLRYDEFKGILGGACGPGQEEIERRRSEHAACLRMDLPDLAECGPGYLRQVTDWHIMERGLLPPVEVTPSTTVLSGIGASSGKVTAVARVLTDPDDGFEAGEILIAKTVDPGWSAILGCAGGVVLDLGGQLSHGAVVARELGIPCVVNAKAASTVVRSGDRVTVDGTTGKLILH